MSELAGLNWRDRASFINAVAQLRPRIKTAKMKKYLEDKGVTVEELLEGLDKLKPYDGIRSSLPVDQCGIIIGECDTPIGQFVLKNYPKVDVCTGINREDTRYNLYFFNARGFKPCHIFHELLHAVTGLDDTALADRLNYKLVNRNTSELSYHLERECL